ncbi:MAG: hypothetical protein Q9211_000995 [Gyalolechia sp. 1 TL-2023]
MATSDLSLSSEEDSAVEAQLSPCQSKAAKVVERPLPPSSLPTLRWHDICSDYYNGYCRNGDECPRDHSICHIQVVASSEDGTPHLSTELNVLSLEPRFPLEGGPFDNEGPAHLAWLGPRHNNDHAEIRFIRILPTTDEILCQRPPYMPFKDSSTGTHHQSGMARMLDVQFRHFRYDTFESVIDACYHASQQLQMAFRQPPPLDYDSRHRTARGTQYSLFHDVRLEDVRFEQGTQLRLSFACPARIRQRGMGSSGHFESGMLMALVGLNSEHTLFTSFCKIEMRQSTSSMKPITGNHLRASVVASFADPSDTDTMRQALYALKQPDRNEKFVIVEFPKVLVAGFYWILKHLQFLSISKNTTAFSDIIAPPDPQTELLIPPPTYSGVEKSTFDLSILQDACHRDNCSTLKAEPHFLNAGLTEQKALVEDICSTTTLDPGQATALCENLSRGLAFTQGPPGTGKTFLGVSLAKVILQHMPKKPILVACMTNHALDNFLGDLLAQGISKVARLGSGSKEDWTGKHTLASLRKNFKNTCAEATKLSKAYQRVKALSDEGTRCCESLNSRVLTWAAVRDHLKWHYRSAFHDFLKCLSPTEQQIEDIRKKRSAAGGFAFEYWCTGGDLADMERFSREIDTYFGMTMPDSSSSGDTSESEDLSPEFSIHQLGIPVILPQGDFEGDAWELPMDVREAWIARWKSELGIANSTDKLAEVQRRYIAAREMKQDIHSDVDARYLADQEVIGMTTTGCAKYWSMLKTLNLQTLICEEAGEIMEAQTISTLLPSIGHAIFIGDPLQLRPQVNQPCLSLETSGGSKYRLDESLFERMVMPQGQDVQALPASKLSLQRRMHPDVADLMRATLYPFLLDHPSTSRLPVAGMAHRTFWLDHQEPEDDPDPFAVGGRSYSNRFECAMICELVRYLINTNDFDSGDIAILVPYSRQLGCLKERLTRTGTCSISLSDKDKEDLANMGLLDDNEQQKFRSDVEVLPMVRLVTIDSFQGEEAKVIILSTVRSNLQDRVGFLQTTNRINVACSRARNGFYIIGNSSLLRTVDIRAFDPVSMVRHIAVTDAVLRFVAYRVVNYLARSHAPFFYLAPMCALGCAASGVPPVGKVLELSESGKITDLKGSMAETCTNLPQCPQCGAPCDDVRRYRHLRQFRVASNTIDRLYNMFGRKMKTFAEKIQGASKELDIGFKLFCKHVEPGPLAGRTNTALVKARMLYIMPTQTMITRFREEVVEGVEKDVAHTVMLLGDTYLAAAPMLPFKCRFDLLYFHCRLTMLREATRISRFLDQSDYSQYTGRIAAKLRTRTIDEAKENVRAITLLIEQCRQYNLKRLEAEAMLVHICYVKLLHDLGIEPEPMGNDACRWLLQVEALILKYPDTAGLLRSSYDSVKSYWESSKTTAADLWTVETRKFWKQWGGLSQVAQSVGG